MRDDYLWDRSGESDPEIERLENVLGRLRSKRPGLEWRAKTTRAVSHWRAAMAASITLVVAASWLATRPAQTGWKVARVEGAPLVGSSAIHQTGRLGIGDRLVTDARSRAKIDVGNIGEVDVEPNSRLRLLSVHTTDHRLALDQGTMHALIWAPPRRFSVETPAAIAVDLGCEYTLTVDAAGSTTLRVIMGWVGFEQRGHESWVPMGAQCVTRPGAEPGTPYFVDAPESFRAALASFDFHHDPALLDAVFTTVRPRDAMSLWHLLRRLHGAEQTRVYDRLAALAPPPATVTREGILNGDRAMLDQWWDALGLGDSSFWRIWKAPSPFKK